MKIKGIILAGGNGTRLSPLTISSSKQLLPVYDKPMIFYPLTTLMLAGIKEIIIITKKNDQQNFRKLLGSGNQWGLKFIYLTQNKPTGLPEAFKISKKYIKNCFVTMILGDNIFYGSNFTNLLKKIVSQKKVRYLLIRLKILQDMELCITKKIKSFLRRNQKILKVILQ